MRKKICPRPQCAKEYLEGEGFDELTVCSICGAPLEEVLVEDYSIEEVTSENDDNVEYETEAFIEEETIDSEDNEEVTIDTNNEDHEVFFDTDSFKCVKENEENYDEIIDPEEIEEFNDENNEYDENVDEEKDNLEELINKDEVSEESDIYDGIQGDNLIIYKDNEIFKVYELKYDETFIGRNSSEFTPDIDLQEIDNENVISRKHILVYREEGKYYMRNLSKKCSVHLKKYNEEVPKEVPFNLSVIIEDGDFIVLSGKFILEAFLEEVEE